MAKRRQSKKRRTSRKKQGVSILGVAETVMLLNVATETLFRTNLMTFVSGSPGLSKPYAHGTSAMSFAELMRGNQHSSGAEQYSTINLIRSNLKAQWVDGAIQMVVIPLGFKFAKQLGKPAISRTNRLLNKVGVGSTVKL